MATTLDSGRKRRVVVLCAAVAVVTLLAGVATVWLVTGGSEEATHEGGDATARSSQQTTSTRSPIVALAREENVSSDDVKVTDCMSEVFTKMKAKLGKQHENANIILHLKQWPPIYEE